MSDKVYAPAAAASASFREPATIEEFIDLAERVNDTSFVPAEFRGKPGEVLAAMLRGREAGLRFMAALTAFYVVGGRATMYAKTKLGIAQASGELEYHEVTVDREKFEASAVVKRRGYEKPVIGFFTWADAQRAGLATKQNWKNYPFNMLKERALDDALSHAFADKLMGLETTEIISDCVECDAPSAPAEPIDVTPRDKE